MHPPLSFPAVNEVTGYLVAAIFVVAYEAIFSPSRVSRRVVGNGMRARNNAPLE